MKVLYLKDWNVERLRRTLPCFANTRALARGTFGVVFETADPNRVLKLTTDSSHYAYLTDGLSPEGPYKPIVLVDHGQVGETDAGLPLYLVEMERLQKIRPGTPNGLLARRIVKYVGASENGFYPTAAGAVQGLSAALARFMDELNFFITDFTCRADAQWSNFMERLDGTLVLSDPVFDKKLHDRTSAAYYRRKQEARGYAYF